MQHEAPSNLPPIDPNALGVLDPANPVAHGPHDLFPGEEHYLRKGPRAKRVKLWHKVAPRVARILEEGERVLHVLPAMQAVTIMQHMGMGWLAYRYNQVALVVTDRRILEVLLDFKGDGLEEQVRSFRWSSLDGIRMRFASMVAKPLQGKKQSWSIKVGGDRKLLKQLLPQIESTLLTRQAASAEACPVIHCPRCDAAVQPKAESCAGCNAGFRSRKLTALLSLAFPGAGLYYAGHPVLGTFDLIGELMVFAWVAFLLAFSSGPVETAGVLVLGAMFLVLTKVESLHVGHILASRIRTEPAGRRQGWGKMAAAGAIASVVALSSLFVVSGKLAGTVDKDLDFSEAVPQWSGSRSASEWTMFADDPSMRSEWSHEDGYTVSVFAYPLGPGEELDQFQAQFVQQTMTEGNLTGEVQELPGRYEGFRALQEFRDDDGTLYTFINYFVYDLQGRDIHQLLSVVPDEYSEEGEKQLQELLESAAWIDPIPPF